MSDLNRGEPVARGAQAGDGDGTHNNADDTSLIIKNDAVIKATYNASVTFDDFRVVLDADAVVLEEYRDAVAGLLAEDYRIANVCASICEDEVRELLAAQRKDMFGEAMGPLSDDLMFKNEIQGLPAPEMNQTQKILTLCLGGAPDQPESYN